MYQQIILIGNLGSDPELRHTASGTPICSFRLAVNKHWTTQDGEKREKTIWFRVSTWQKQAEVVHQYLTKGRQVMVIGEVEEASAYVNKAGEPAASLEVTARLIKFLGGDNSGDHLDNPVDSETVAPVRVNGAARVSRQWAEADIPF